MARTVRDATLDSRSARARLKVRAKPYFRSLDQGVHLGYRRSSSGGSWMVRIYLGKQTYKTEKLATADDKGEADGHNVLSFSQAQARARTRMSELTRAAAGLPTHRGPFTVAAAMADYIDWLEQERRTARDARWAADAFINPKLGNVHCERLTAPQIKKWLHDIAKAPPRLRAKKGAKPRHRQVDLTDAETRRRRQSSANRILTTLKAALNKAWRDDRVASDKAWRSVQPFKGADASRLRYLSLDECRRLINASAADLREVVKAALHTGARYSELGRLRADDYNPDAGTLSVRMSKSGKPRHVVLTEDGQRFFAQAIAHTHDRQFLFVRAGGESWEKSQQHRPIKAASAAARIKGASFHTLRHTYASHAIMNGVPSLVVARNLGHSDTRMVEKHYGHLAPSYEADAIRAGALRFETGGNQVVAPIGKRASAGVATIRKVNNVVPTSRERMA